MKKIKKRYIFCISAIAVILVSYFIFLCTYGSRYTISVLLEGTTDLSTIRVECSNDNTVRVKGIRQGSIVGFANTLDVELESIGHGDVGVTVYYDSIYDAEVPDENNTPHMKQMREPKEFESYYHVTSFGMIWCTSNDDFNGLWSIRLFVDAIMIVLIITFIISFHEKNKKGDFTYSLVTLGGMIFFMTVTVLFSLYDTIFDVEYSKVMSVRIILYSISNIASSFVYATVIPLIVFCLMLTISNIQLVRHEGFRVQNLLGLLLGLSVICGVVVMYFLRNNLFMYSEAQQFLMTVINAAVSFTFCYMECLLVSTIVCALMSTRYKITKPMDYIIILGCAIQKDGSPTPILRGRIDRALAFEKNQYERLNIHAKYVPSGGQGSNEVISEAESMKRYLMKQGIPEERILKEDKSVNTYQNMAFSKKIIEADGGNIGGDCIAFSTTNYHVFRGYTLAEKIGMKVKGLSARTKLYFFPNAFLREFVGLIVEQKIRHLIFVVLGVVFFTSLYLIAIF